MHTQPVPPLHSFAQFWPERSAASHWPRCATPEGKTKSFKFTLPGGGFNGPIRVISDDGKKWTRIKPDTKLLFQGNVKVERSEISVSIWVSAAAMAAALPPFP
jgi:hypothetical protein